MDRAFDLAQQPGQHRIGFGLAAEERHLDAVGEILVDQHADVLTVLQRLRQLERRVVAGRDQRAHLDRAHFLDDAVGGGDVRSPVQHRGVQPVGDGAARAGSSQLPRWLAKISAGLPSIAQLAESSCGARLDFDAAVLGMRGIVIPDVIEMGEFGADASEIVPDARENAPRSPRAIFPETPRSGWRGRCAVRAVIGPIQRVTRPNRLAVLIGSK